MIAIISLLATLALSLIVTRIGSVALTLTGLSRESARFQARSAFTGVGFTTNESENVVNHPVRRRIVMILMLLSNVGVATLMATVIVSLLNTASDADWTRNLALLAVGILALSMVSRSQYVERQMTRLITWSLKKWTRLDVRDYVAVLQLSSGYAVSEAKIGPNDWLAGQTLQEARLPAEGVLVLGIQRRDGHYVGAPHASTVIQAFDTLIIYGPLKRLEELDQRRAGQRGQRAHQAAVVEHQESIAKEGDASDDND